MTFSVWSYDFIELNDKLLIVEGKMEFDLVSKIAIYFIYSL